MPEMATYPHIQVLSLWSSACILYPAQRSVSRGLFLLWRPERTSLIKIKSDHSVSELERGVWSKTVLELFLEELQIEMSKGNEGRGQEKQQA